MDPFKSINRGVDSLHRNSLVNPSRAAGWLKTGESDKAANLTGRLNANSKILFVSWISGVTRIGANALMAVANLVIAVVSPIFCQFATSRNAFLRLGGNFKQIGHGAMLSIPLINVLYMKSLGLHSVERQDALPALQQNDQPVPADNEPVAPENPKAPWEETTKLINLIHNFVNKTKKGEALEIPDAFKTNLGWVKETPPDLWLGQPKEKSPESIEGVPFEIDHQTFVDLTRRKVSIGDQSYTGGLQIYEAISKLIPEETPDRLEIIKIAMASTNQAFAPNIDDCMTSLAIHNNLYMGQISHSPENKVTFNWEEGRLKGTFSWSYQISDMENPGESMVNMTISHHFHVTSEAKVISEGETYMLSPTV